MASPDEEIDIAIEKLGCAVFVAAVLFIGLIITFVKVWTS